MRSVMGPRRLANVMRVTLALAIPLAICVMGIAPAMAHCQSAMAWADQITVLQGGRMVESET